MLITLSLLAVCLHRHISFFFFLFFFFFFFFFFSSSYWAPVAIAPGSTAACWITVQARL
jgi:hypothetical protein